MKSLVVRVVIDHHAGVYSIYKGRVGSTKEKWNGEEDVEDKQTRWGEARKEEMAGSASDNLPSIVEVAVGEAELSEKEPDLLVGPVQYGTDSHHVRPALVRHLYTQYKREELEWVENQQQTGQTHSK